MKRSLILVAVLWGCDKAPTPAAAPPSAIYPAAAPTAAPMTEPARVERVPDPPRQVDGVWIYETLGQFLDTFLGGQEPGRVRISGPVGGVIELGGSAGTRFLLGPATRRYAEARFRDGGAEAARKRVAQGSIIAVECQASERLGRNALLTDCVLK